MADLRCPKGHSGPFDYVDTHSESRLVKGIDDQGRLVVGQSKGCNYEDTKDAHLECRFLLSEKSQRFCDAAFPLPDLEIEWE